MKWWLISDEVTVEVIRALRCACATAGTDLVTRYKDALHSLETGLHETEAVPSDCADEFPAVPEDPASPYRFA